MTKVIGLTGSIATGKSTAADIFRKQNIKVIDLDKLTHDLENDNAQVIDEIRNNFGRSVISDDKVNRKKLGEIVFNNPKSMKKLVDILNPFLLKMVKDKLKGDIVVLDAPTLFENGFEFLTDLVVMVICDPVVQIQRLQKRNHVSISKANTLIAAQWSQAIKKELSDVVIDSSKGSLQLEQQILALLENLR